MTDLQPGDEFAPLQRKEESSSWVPWIAAIVIVVAAVAVIVFLGRDSGSAPGAGAVGMANAAPYAPSLPISDLKMSEAASFSGAKVTYIDGEITNTGRETITAITVQAGFRNDLHQLSLRSAMPLTLIRATEPYIDIEPVSADPIQPGQRRRFRLIFDSIPEDWNQQFPEIRVIATQGH